MREDADAALASVLGGYHERESPAKNRRQARFCCGPRQKRTFSWGQVRESLVARAVAGIVGPMARPYPYPCANRARLASLGSAAGLALLLSAGGCRSDEPLDTITTEVDLTTGVHMTGIPFTTGEAAETSSGTGVEPTDETCRSALNCVGMCLIDISMDDTPEQDYSCVLECTSGMSTAEWLAFLRFSRCVTEACFERMECTEHGENDDDDCQDCLLGNLVLPQPEGCEAEGLACK